MKHFGQLCRDYQRVEHAIAFLESEFHRRPPLGEVAEAVGLSGFHFQRLFSRWVGISPKRFLQFLTKEHAKQLIAGSANILDAAYDAGLSSLGRLHDLFVTCEAVTPGQYKSRGDGLRVVYGMHPSPFGECFLAATGRGICALEFAGPRRRQELVDRLRRQWPAATLAHRPEETAVLLAKVFDFTPEHTPAPVHLHVQGTNFQIKVWEALLKIPLGKAVTYEDIARHIGMPRAARAVGNAVGRNPIPFLIPCHRVIRKMGEFGHYGGGSARKKAMLAWEAVAAMERNAA